MRDVRVLVIDDEPAIARALRPALHGHNFTVVTADTGGEPVHLSPTEFSLLETLMSNTGRLVTHRTLLHKVWGPEYVGDTQLLRVYIGQLRGKIEEQPDRADYIITEPGVGYRFRDEVIYFFRPNTK
jgi:DNA-binding response OmpR family regulator